MSSFGSGGLHNPEVGVGVDGSFVVAWQDSSAEGTQLSGRAYDANATPRSAAFQIEEDPNGGYYETRPAISFDGRSGESRIAWTSFGGIPSHLRVRSRRFSVTGEPLGTELAVAGTESFDGSAYVPALGLSGTSRWVLAWSGSNDATNGVDSFAQTFDGDSPVAPPIPLNIPSPGGYYSAVRAATDPFGNSVAVWHADLDFDIVGDLWGRRISREGVALGDEIRIALEGAGGQLPCDVAMDSQGRFVVAWEQGDAVAEGSSNVYARRFGADGVPLGDPFRVPTESTGAQYDCDLAMNREGDFVVVWKHDLGTQENQEDLYVRAYRADGTPYGSPVRVDEPRPPGGDHSWIAVHPSIAINDAGVFVVAWEGGWTEGPQQIFARKLVLPCSGSPTSLCLGGDRFRLHADWWVGEERTADANALPMRDETGGFWFFAGDNPELIVKVLDGCGSNDHHWIYAAGLTDVEVHLSVTNTATGEVWSRVNPWQQPFAPLQDIEALNGCPSSANSLTPVHRPIQRPHPIQTLKNDLEQMTETFDCSPSATTLCLMDGRFEATATYQTWSSPESPATAVALTETSGIFWFFSEDNLEVFIKVIDACAEFGRIWVYAAGLTNLEVTLTVRDSWTDQIVTYPNVLGNPFQLMRDTFSFATCEAF